MIIISIGLYDIDMQKYHQVPLNLELAKISAYYKKKREIVVLSPYFMPERFSHFIVRKDYDDGDFDFAKDKNIEIGGLALSNNKYKALPLDIEKQVPDINIYENYKDIFCINKKYSERFEVMMNAIHLRLSLDGITIWDDFYKQIDDIDKKGILFFHDYNLNSIENCDIIIKELINKRKRAPLYDSVVAAKFPIVVNNEIDLLKWGRMKPSIDFYPIRYEGIANDEALYEFRERVTGSCILNQFEYNITGGGLTEEEVIQAMPKIYTQVLFFKYARERIKITYDSNFFTDSRWEDIVELINRFCRVFLYDDQLFFSHIKSSTMYTYAQQMQYHSQTHERPYTIEEMREMFMFVKENSPELFDMFYNLEIVIFKGGKFINGKDDWRRNKE